MLLVFDNKAMEPLNLQRSSLPIAQIFSRAEELSYLS